MPFYRAAGTVPKKRHTKAERPDGGLYAEELMSAHGFSGMTSLLYHRGLPTTIVEAEVFEGPTDEARPNHPLLPRHFRTGQIGDGADLVTGRQLLMANRQVRIGFARASGASSLYRNAMADECVFIQSGEAILESVFGELPARSGDYVVIPKSTTHRWVPAGEVRALVLELSGHVDIPRRYRSPEGQLLESAPYSERDLRGPSPTEPVDGEGVEVLVHHGTGLWTRYVYATHPFDVVGWDGWIYPFAFNIGDFEPRVGRVHLPPPIHQTFEAPGAVICSFCPRPYDFDKNAIAVPYNHANVDSDEVLFYVAGDFMSRKGSGIESGSISLHPAGFVHGPQPGSVEAAFGEPGTEE
ncbi:MAG TPA: homogentisate 1,2-dioxygenase, partial [Acidimicrobiales bacterium]|nr:homogentisate 1,2-dioxygenase [Acidimicrobiales bacterium]